MILVEYRTKDKNPRKERTYFLSVAEQTASSIESAKEYARRALGNNIEILKALYVGTYLEK
jgi:hypothetical protein